KELIAVGKPVVHSRGDGGLIGVVKTQAEPVSSHQRIIGAVGLRRDAVKMSGERAETADGDLVVRKYLPLPVGVSGPRIVQRVLAAAAVDEAAESALPHGGGRHAHRSGVRLP